VLDLEGYEGPIDVLLQLARDQKVDLTHISILALADQYLDFVSRVRELRLELAADYLVMAAWLAYLKSRLLLPGPGNDEEPSGAEMAAALKYQLQRLLAMREAGARLMGLPRLGRDVFARGEPAPLRVVAETTYDISLYELLSAYGRTRPGGAFFGRRCVAAPGQAARCDARLEHLDQLPAGGPAERPAVALRRCLDPGRDARNVPPRTGTHPPGRPVPADLPAPRP
jgi:hypothetical protein